ncbi:MAG: DEAD/DEAH box helicase [Methylococcaceae bacterium]|nr:DEAD/DEAH box helicase [Methylococcaceae bacterium]
MQSLASIKNPFSRLGLDKSLITAINEVGFQIPTPVQKQGIPAVLEGKDLLVSAETGSGKTAAFLLPALQQLIASSPITGGIAVLILCPTRELAQQIYEQCRLLSKYTTFKTGLITGGSDFKRQQFSLINENNIIIATPGRLLEHFELNTDYFQDLNLLILDEADRMLDMGFSDAVLEIARHCNRDRQTLLFSATLNHSGVIRMAEKVLNNQAVIALNTLQDGHGNITQQLVLADDHDHKLKLLAWLLLNENFDKALVFANTRLRAIELYETMRASGIRVGLLHGEMDQKDRNRVMALYRDGVVNSLIATDLAARGLDIKGINLVINFDMPRNGISYIHRIGRTGRADDQGITIALVKHTEWNLMSGIERFLNQKFIRRTIKELEGSFKGPKKVKGSGKAAGSKDKKEPPKKAAVKKVKVRERDKKNVGKRRAPRTKQDAE